MLIRQIIKVNQSHYVSIPTEIRRKMNLGYGDNVVLGVLPNGVMYAVKIDQILSPEKVSDIAHLIQSQVYGQPNART